MINPSDSRLPVEDGLIRADTYISIPLAQELHRKGHQVSFITSNDSEINLPQYKITQNALFSYIPENHLLRCLDVEKKNELSKLFFSKYITEAAKIIKKEQFDLIHIHSNHFIYELGFLDQLGNIPIFVTLHSQLAPSRDLRFLPELFHLKNCYFISISDHQRRQFPYSFYSTIHHGINVQEFTFDPIGGHSLLFTGRFRKEKGIEDALLATEKTDSTITCAGRTSGGSKYESEIILPLIKHRDKKCINLGYMARGNMPALYKKSKATFFPIHLEEPFGLVQIESMACGTPVIAYARGSVPEIIKDGETGFIINSSDDDIRGNWIIQKTGIDGLCEAIEKIYTMDKAQYRQMRLNCRAHVEQNFTLEIMTNKYMGVYQNVIAKKNEKNKTRYH